MSDVPEEKICSDTIVSEAEETPERSAPSEAPVKSRGDIAGALKCMMSFFTIIRLDVGEKEMNAMERNFWLVPALGALNGLLVFLVCIILSLCNMSVLIISAAALFTAYIFSKFLHFDGLTDFGDGIIVSSGKREDHIRALKDSLIGAGGFGVALCVVIMTICLYAYVGSETTSWFDSKIIILATFAFMAEILVKNAQVAAAAFGNPGTGMASRQVSFTTNSSLIKSTVLTVVLLLIPFIIEWVFTSKADYTWSTDLSKLLLIYVFGLIMSIVVGYAMARKANNTFGFVNGDILGATNEISRCAVLFVTALILGLLL